MTDPTSYRITVGVTPTVLATAAGSIVGLAVILRNTDSSVSVFLGDSAVTISTGFEVRAGEGFSLVLGNAGRDNPQILYAISAGSVVVDVMTRLAE